MKIPLAPPTEQPLEVLLPHLNALLAAEVSIGKYLHWDEFRHRTPPPGTTIEQFWTFVKVRRRVSYLKTPLTDRKGRAFVYTMARPIPERLHNIDISVGSRLEMDPSWLSTEQKDQYYVSSIMEEAITSSQLEGAVTTRRVAREMIRNGRAPRDRSERMILNNYNTMVRLREIAQDPLTPGAVLELHELITRDTLEDPASAGRLRREDEDIVVADDIGTVFHVPPPAEQLQKRLERMCDFANAKGSREFIHPVIRSVVLHFWLAYDHPFVDGNGRTARALFYWSMMKQGYRVFEYVSISDIILKGRSRYYRAFLHTDTDDNDLTYFLLYHLEVLRRGVEALHAHIDRKSRELQSVASALRGATGFNHRQLALLAHAVRHPGYRYTIEGHRVSHDIVYQTARTDLLSLAKRGLLTAGRVGKSHVFEPVPDISSKLRTVGRKKRRAG